MSSNTSSSLISSNFLNDLKTHTAESHKKLEGLPVSASILSPDMNIENYCNYISLMHDVHNSAEEVVFPLLSNIVDDLKDRKKKHLIEEDLLFLDCNKTVSTSVFNAPEMSVPFALGILYVIEGSSLGGRFILKNVALNPKLSGNQGVSYFSGYGDRTGSYWKSFLNTLSEYEQTNNCGDAIIEGAVYAFNRIYYHFGGR
ncbi:biliverdin-producing heme oxygenase [Flavobacterium reichenbachii]|uniref:Heme oxygenase n=1 Tax=Flavobacterium reichenbachii TaxID=362418 RepID=A0A085ZEX4_9FLAO|nr:biliverdin-producing heme oxygenase [Flavobacterium reichenbachii]KFF02988.1 hypothetical protein IW19_22900 [Flavobacterium reichenbachii]OXB16980.1 hypothetical protein B0A68_06035 [Flavobacterium reichenbachii]